MDVTILGPQRRPNGARTAVGQLMPHGPVATVNAGWQERESDTRELEDVLGGRMVNLELYRRWRQISEADPAYAAAERELSRALEDLRSGYLVRLRHALAAAREAAARVSDPELRELTVEDALRTVRELDDWHLARAEDLRSAFSSATGPARRESVAVHRERVAALLAGSVGTVVAGGHVGVLVHLLDVFGLAGRLRSPVLTWSAGAMALGERIVLFHDQAADGPRPAEVHGRGLGCYRGLIPFPHARRRLRLDDPAERVLFARRWAPRTPLLLDEGARVDVHGDRLAGRARVVSPDGRVVDLAPRDLPGGEATGAGPAYPDRVPS